MAGAVAQDPLIIQGPNSTTLAHAYTINPGAGSTLVCFGTNDIGGSPTPSVADNVNGAYAALTDGTHGTFDVTDTTDGQRCFGFFKENTTGGATTTTITWTATAAAVGMCILELSGNAGAGSMEKVVFQLQGDGGAALPGTGTDAVTSGSTGALSKSPNLVVAFSYDFGGTTAPATGTGYSSPNGAWAGWATIGGCRVETKNTSSTAAVAGTFTAAANSIHVTVVMVIDDAGSTGGSVTTLTEDQRPAGHPYRAPTDRYPSSQAPDPAGAPAASTRSYFQAEPTIVAPRVHAPPPRPFTVEAWVPPPIVIVPPSLGTILPDQQIPPQRRFPPDPIQEDAPGTRLGSTIPMAWPTSASSPQRPTLKQPRPDTAPFTQAASPVIAPFFHDAPPSYRRPLPPPTRAPFHSQFDSPKSLISRFPIVTTSGSRKMFDQQGNPWRFKGRTAWGLASLTPSLRASFIANTLSYGFNTVECQIPTHLSHINNVPQDGAGNLPFLKKLDGSTYTGVLSPFANPHSDAPDFSTPNLTYWAFIDSLVQDFYLSNILLMIFPAYLGDGSGDGWQDEMQANIDVNGDTSISNYGAFVANRYKSFPNIVWMTAGDTASGFDPENDLITGLQSVSGQASGPNFSSERAGGQISTDGVGPLGASTTLNGAYDWATVITQCQRAYSFASPVMPGYLLEEPYDEEGSDGTGVNTTFSTQPVRRYEWWGWLNSIGGYVAGNGYVWRFALTGSPLPTDDYRNHLDTQNTHDLGRLNAFMEMWPNTNDLVPGGLGGMRTLVVSGAGTIDTGNFNCAAQTTDGTLMIAYVSPGGASTIQIDLRSMSGAAPGIRARWWDPTAASFTTNASAAGTFTLSNTASAQSFTTPGTNSTGTDSDWVLVLDAPATTWAFLQEFVGRPWRAVKRAIGTVAEWILPPPAAAAQPGALDTPRSTTQAPARHAPILDTWSAPAIGASGSNLGGAEGPADSAPAPRRAGPAEPWSAPAIAAAGSSFGAGEGPADSGAPARRAGPGLSEPWLAPPLGMIGAAGWESAGPAPAEPAQRWTRVPGGELWILAPAATIAPSGWEVSAPTESAPASRRPLLGEAFAPPLPESTLLDATSGPIARSAPRPAGGEVWILPPPAAAPPTDILDGYLPRASQPRAQRAGAELPWFGAQLVGLAPWFEQSPVRSQQPRGQAQFEGQWLPTALPPPSTPQGWNIYPARSGAVTRPIQDLAGWILPPIASLAPIGWDSPAPARRAPGSSAAIGTQAPLVLGAAVLATVWDQGPAGRSPTGARGLLTEVALPALVVAQPVLTLADQQLVAPRAAARRPLVDDASALRLLATPLPPALNDPLIARAPAHRAQLVEPWVVPPLVTFVPGGMPDPTPAPPRPPPLHPLQEPLFSAPLGPALAPWYEVSPIRSQQPHGRIFDWWFETPIIAVRLVPRAQLGAGPLRGAPKFRGPTGAGR